MRVALTTKLTTVSTTDKLLDYISSYNNNYKSQFIFKIINYNKLRMDNDCQEVKNAPEILVIII